MEHLLNIDSASGRRSGNAIRIYIFLNTSLILEASVSKLQYWTTSNFLDLTHAMFQLFNT